MTTTTPLTHPRVAAVPRAGGGEVTFGRDELIVSKTDPRGHITYANDVFVRVSGYTLDELTGRPHNVIRHPDMPRGVFRLLWDTLGEGREIFAYIKNATKDGGYYWVLAHVTPTVDAAGRTIGYHSNRRSPDPGVVARVVPLYDRMLRAEAGLPGPKAADASSALLAEHLAESGCTYEEFVWSLILGGNV